MALIRFLTNEAGKTEGLAYAGFETFRGSPYTSCARETGQNSRDAHEGAGPVKVDFRMHRLDRADVPFADQLQHSIECCLAAPYDEETRLHLERARATISAPVIKVLEVADRNTTGLTGPIGNDRSVFNALVKGDGVTNKLDATSAGSYGIGKNAAYAVSDLQTVIYSTCYREPGTDDVRFAAQGRLRLISHTDGGAKKSAEGYWGDPDFAAIEDPSAVPAWMARTKVGTSIFSVGFREEDHWESRMTLSLATNFFLAIDRGEIEFRVGDNVRMNRISLDSVLASTDLETIAVQADRTHELVRARLLLQCARSEAASRHPITVNGLGNFTLHLLVGEGLPREIHILRNGIYITDGFPKFGQPLRSLRGTKEYIALLEPARTDEGKAPSSLLKQLENPEHNAFEPERLIDVTKRETAKAQIKQLIRKVKDIIRAEAKIGEQSRSQLDELAYLFADPQRAESGADDAEKDPDRFRYGEARRGRRGRSHGTEGKGRARTRRGNKRGTQPGTRTGKGKRTGKAAGMQEAVPLEAVRSVVPDPADARNRTVWFTPGADGDVVLAISASGLSGDVELAVTGASEGTAANGRVRAEVRSGERLRLDVTFAEPFAGPIELTASRPAAREGEAA